MRKDQFLAQLRRSLGGMDETEKKEILYDYEEHFRIGAAEGKDEEQIAGSLGNPRVIGNSYRIEGMLEEPSAGGGVTAGSVLRAVFASLSLTFFNLVVVIGPFFGLVGVMIGLWAAAVSLPLAGIAGIVALVASAVVPHLFSLSGMNPGFLVFAGIGVSALGVLAVIGMLLLTKMFIHGVAEYVKMNVRIVTRRR